jgi:hypothetical protein
MSVPGRERRGPVDCRDCGAQRDDHGARGLCSRCARRHQRAGTITDWPLLIRPAADVLDDIAVLRARMPDATWAELAQQIGMSKVALVRAVHRHRQRERQQSLAPGVRPGVS